MALDPITSIIDAGKTVLNKFVRDKASEGELIQLQQGFELELRREANRQGSDFRNFILQYEGSAKDVPRIVVILRSLIRPVFTVLVGVLDWKYFSGTVTTWTPEAVALLKAINIIVLAFWFGERAIKNSGVIDILKKRS